MEAQEAIERGIQAARAGNQRTAYYYFNAATRADPTSEQAWLWRASAAPRPEEALNCLAAVLALNPDNPVARHGLEQISAAVAATRDQEPEAITPSRVVKETEFQPPERRLEWQQTFQRDHYDAGRVAHLAAPAEREPAAPAAPQADGPAVPAIVAMLTAPDLPEADAANGESSVLRPVGNLVDGVRRNLVDRNAQRRQLTLATALPTALIIALVIVVAALQFPARGAAPPPTTPVILPPTATPVVVVPPPENPTNTPVAEVVNTPEPPPAATDTPAPPPEIPTDTPAPPPEVPTDTPAPPPPATDTPAPQGEQTYTVGPQDTLSSIAGKFGVSLAALMAANNLTHPFDAKPGQQLKIPPPDFRPTEIKHRVLPGENLTGIAALYGVNPDAIGARNNLTNPNQVYIGQELIIPLP